MSVALGELPLPCVRCSIWRPPGLAAPEPEGVASSAFEQPSTSASPAAARSVFRMGASSAKGAEHSEGRHARPACCAERSGEDHAVDDAMTTPASEAPQRARLLSRVERVLNHGNYGNPDVLLVVHEGRECVLKDYAPRSWLIRNTVGRWITALESRAWRALEGHPNVPRFIARVDALALLAEYRPGRPVSGRRAVPASFLAELERAIEELHRRGIVHLDLSHRSNVLVDAAGHPVLIDFGSALTLRPGGLLARWLARVDRRALAKWKAKLVSSAA